MLLLKTRRYSALPRLSTHLAHIKRSKLPELLLIFSCISTGHSHFQNNQIYILWEPTRPTTVFFRQESPLGRPVSKFVKSTYVQFSTQERKPPLSPSLPMHNLCLAFMSCMWTAFPHLGVERLTSVCCACIHASTHAHTHAFLLIITISCTVV